MKKLLAIILVLAMMLPLVGIAEINVDLESLSYEELVALFEKVQMALFGHSLTDGVEIPYGDYVAGQDIPAGGYVISLTGGENDLIGVTGFLPGAAVNDPDWFSYIRTNESFRFTLSDGMKLTVMSGGPKIAGKIMLKSFAGLFAK